MDGSDVTRVARLKEFAGGEVADQAAVGGEEIVFGELFEFHPLELLEDLVFEFALEGRNSEELKVDRSAMAIVVADVCDARADGGKDAEFFLEFPGERLFRAFAVLDFTAGELPLEGHGLIGPALANQDLSVPNQQACGDETERGTGRARFGDRLRLFHDSSVNGG